MAVRVWSWVQPHPLTRRGPLGRLHRGTPHPGPLPFGRGEGEPSSGFGVVQVADYSVRFKWLLIPLAWTIFFVVVLMRFDDQWKSHAAQYFLGLGGLTCVLFGAATW